MEVWRRVRIGFFGTQKAEVAQKGDPGVPGVAGPWPRLRAHELKRSGDQIQRLAGGISTPEFDSSARFRDPGSNEINDLAAIFRDLCSGMCSLFISVFPLV